MKNIMIEEWRQYVRTEKAGAGIYKLAGRL